MARVLLASRWHARCAGTLRNRIVLRTNQCHPKEYVVCSEIEAPDGSTSFGNGTYFRSWLSAGKAFIEYAERWEAQFARYLEAE